MNKSDFAERLSELMQDAGITAEKLGKAINVAATTVWLWLNDVNGISLSNALSVADFFNCSLEYLFGKTDKLLDYTIHEPPPFYGQLTKIMRLKNITVYRLCKELKKSNKHFIKWKNGAVPQMETVIELADYLNCSIDFLVGRES